MNDYVIGYDKAIKKDRSSLIISKYNNSNLYVLAEFYDEKADLLNEIITNLQQENKQLKEDKKKAIECIHLFGIYKDTPDKGLDIRKILKNILEILGDKEW